MAWTVKELVHDLRELGRGAAERTVVVGGRWGISMGLDDQGRASLSALAHYLGELPEYRNLAVAKRAAVIGYLLPPDRDEAVAVATSAVDHRRTE